MTKLPVSYCDDSVFADDPRAQKRESSTLSVVASNLSPAKACMCSLSIAFVTGVIHTMFDHRVMKQIRTNYNQLQ